MQNKIFATHAHALVEAGFSVIPASGKRPLIKGWTEFCTRLPNEKEISDWSKNYPDANISLCMGSASNLVAIDYDYNIAGEHDAIQAELPQSPLMKQGRKGFTAFYKYSGETNRSFAKEGKTSIDLLSLNKCSIIPPSQHPETKNPYIWLTENILNIKPTDLPNLTRDNIAFIESFFPKNNNVIPLNFESKQYTQKDVSDALECLKVIPADSYDIWLQVGFALSYKFCDDGFSYFNEWSKKSDKYTNEQNCYQKWQSIRNDKTSLIKFGTLKHLAGLYKNQKEPLIIKSYSVFDLHENHKPKEDLVGSRLITNGGVVLLAGIPKVGKSLFLLHFCLNASIGNSFLDFEIKRPLKIFYINTEIGKDFFAERIRDAKFTNEELQKAQENFYITERFIGTLDDEAIEALTTEINQAFKGEKPDLIVIDPLANISDANENDNAEMMNFFRKLKKDFADKINPEGALVIAHHMGKNYSMRDIDPFAMLRGASAIRGFYNSGILMDKTSPESKVIKLHFELRDGKSIKSKTVSFDGNKWIYKNYSLDISNKNRAMRLGADRDTKQQKIIEFLRDEALLGKLYTKETASQILEGKIPDLGGARTIKNYIDTLTTQQLVKFTKKDYFETKLSNNCDGYLVVEDMELCIINNETGEIVSRVAIEATHYKNESSGKVEKC